MKQEKKIADMNDGDKDQSNQEMETTTKQYARLKCLDSFLFFL